MKRPYLFFILIMMLTSISKAGILFEPIIGYQYGTTKFVATTTLVETSNTMTMPYGGLRLGIRYMGFWMGVEGAAGFSGKLTPSSGTARDISSTTGFGMIGYDFLSRIRIWAGGGVSDTLTLKAKDTSSESEIYSGGTTLKAGFGYVIYSHTSLNLDFYSHEYKKYKSGTTEGDLTSSGMDSVKNTSAALSLSFPFSL